ncbi:MAG: hypothetical protein Q9183_003853, partial [Haloplaca sp. 2 TL-2023]
SSRGVKRLVFGYESSQRENRRQARQTPLQLPSIMPRPKKLGAPEPKTRSRNGCWYLSSLPEIPATADPLRRVGLARIEKSNAERRNLSVRIANGLARSATTVSA